MRLWAIIGSAFPVACAVLLTLLGAVQAGAAFQPDLQVKLASEADSGYLGGGVFETTAALQSRSAASFPGIPASFTVLLRNAGDQPDSFQLSGTGSLNGATVRFLAPSGTDRAAALSAGFATPVLAPGESIAYRVQVAPVALQPGASFRVVVGAASQGDPARIDQVKTETVSCGSTAALILSAPPDGTGAPGSVVYYPYTVTNVGNAPNSFALAASTPAGWNGALYADDGAGGGLAGDGVRQGGETTLAASTGLLAPGASYRFFLVVAVPAGSADGAFAEARVTATGEGTSGLDRVGTSALAPTVLLQESVRNLTLGGVFAASADARPGDLLEYRMAVTNSGSVPAAPVTLSSSLPTNASAVAGSFKIATSAGGAGDGCAAAVCGTVRQTGGAILAQLGTGVSGTAGGSLAPGSTLYVFFRVQVE